MANVQKEATVSLWAMGSVQNAPNLLAPPISIGSGRAASGSGSLCSELDCNRRQHQWPHILCQCSEHEQCGTVFRKW